MHDVRLMYDVRNHKVVLQRTADVRAFRSYLKRM